jgi:hypothetical protein
VNVTPLPHEPPGLRAISYFSDPNAMAMCSTHRSRSDRRR